MGFVANMLIEDHIEDVKKYKTEIWNLKQLIIALINTNERQRARYKRLRARMKQLRQSLQPAPLTEADIERYRE